MTTSFATAGDVSIRIHHLGGSGPALVCVHATGFHGRIWEPFVPRLRQHFSIVALDQRGHGDSDKPQDGYDWERFGEDVLAVVEHLELSSPRGIGHSAGAAALVFAETSRPGTFSRLALMDPVTPPPEVRSFMSGESNPMSEQARRRRAVWDDDEQMISRLRSGSSLQGWREEFLRAYVTYGTVRRDDGKLELKCPPEVEAQIYMMGGRHEGYERLADLKPPTLFLTGSDSPLWQRQAESAVARMPDGRSETVAGGHFFPMENPEATLDLLLPFLIG